MGVVDQKLYVCGLDIGTANTGACLRILSDRLEKMISGLTVAPTGVTKIPTSILLDPTLRTLEEFGEKAEATYSHGKNVLFKKFKMQLYERDGGFVSSTPVVWSVCKRYKLSATEAMRFVYQYLISEVDKTIKNWYPDFQLVEALWVITVPAIWSEGAKQIMREAAVEAGLRTENIRMCHEPLAASLFLRKYNVEPELSELNQPGTVSMTVDCGGGTIDVALYKIIGDNNIELLQAASGGNWGSTYVDENYLALLQEVFNPLFDYWLEAHPQELFEVERDFQIQKAQWTRGANLTVTITPIVLYVDSLAQGSHIKEISKKLQAKGIERNKWKLVLPAEIVESLFSPLVKRIVQLVGERLAQCRERCDVVNVVGGFARCKYLIEELKSNFSPIPIYVPPHPETSIVVGATLFGMQTVSASVFVNNMVLSRCWGIQVCSLFNPDVHQVDKRFLVEGVWRVHQFECFIVSDRSYNRDWRETRTFRPLHKTAKEIVIRVMTADKPTDDIMQCKQLGQILISTPVDPNGSNDRPVSVTFSMDDCEVIVVARNVRTDEEKFVNVNYLLND